MTCIIGVENIVYQYITKTGVLFCIHYKFFFFFFLKPYITRFLSIIRFHQYNTADPNVFHVVPVWQKQHIDGVMRSIPHIITTSGTFIDQRNLTEDTKSLVEKPMTDPEPIQ